MVISESALEGRVRLFIAVELPDYIQEEIVRLQKSLMDRNVIRGAYPKAEAMHLTLKFIGDVNGSSIPLIRQVLRAVKSGYMHARMAKLMFFGDPRFPKVIYVAIDCPGLGEFVRGINRALDGLCAVQEREFKPHITLVRVQEIIDYQACMDWIEDARVERLSFPIESFVLMQSRLDSSGPIHIPIERYMFTP
jgi:2'-5' RNA ligase